MLRRAVDYCCPVAPFTDSCVTAGNKSCSFISTLTPCFGMERTMTTRGQKLPLGALWELAYVSNNLGSLLILLFHLFLPWR